MDINEALIQLGTTIVIALIGVLGTYVTMYARKAVVRVGLEIDKIENKQTKLLVSGALESLQDLVLQNVQSAQLTLVKEVKNASADNSITKEDGEKILGVVKDNILKQLTDEGKTLLSKEIGDLDAYITTLVETSLGNIKSQIK